MPPYDVGQRRSHLVRRLTRIENTTHMAKASKHELYVVDGSNIATEGRAAPSLEQLNEAVLAFLDDHPGATVTVVVDATFGHRIAKKEVKAFDEAVANNELVTPPAGAVGRGDAFVLSIADKAKAGVLSNDSFQEFHGEYEWLFDAGRLIGGKPVPHVGWVFVERTPVRGPKSRQAVRDAKDDATSTKERANRRVKKKAAARSGEAAADEPAAEPADAGSGSSRGGRRGRRRGKQTVDAEQQRTIEEAKAATAPKEHVNDLMPFLEFVEKHPVGTSCTGVVESYASHGAYARVDDVLIYIPLRLMEDPAPRSARSVLTIGEAVAVVIVGYVPDRRSIDAALPHMAGVASTAEPASGDGAASSAKKTAAKKTEAKKTAAKKTAAKRAPAKRTAAKESGAKQAPAKRTAAKKTAAKKTAAKKTAAKKSPAKTTPAKTTPAKTTPAKTTPAKKSPAKKSPAKRSATKKAPAKKAAATKASAKKAPARRRSAAKKSAATTDS